MKVKSDGLNFAVIFFDYFPFLKSEIIYVAHASYQYPTEKIRLPVAGINLSGTRQHLDFYSRHLNQKMLSMLSSHHLPNVSPFFIFSP